MDNRIEEDKNRLNEEICTYAATKKRKITIIGGFVGTAVVLFFIVLIIVIIPASNYGKAENLLAVGKYEEAISILAELGDYKDSLELIRDANYNRAQNLMAQNNIQSLTEAQEMLLVLSGYRDSDTILTKCQYLLGSLYEREYRKASNIIEPSGSIVTVGQINAAKEIFDMIAGYKDSESKSTQCAEAIKWQGTWTWISESGAYSRGNLYYVIIFDYFGQQVYYAPATFTKERSHFKLYPCTFSDNTATFIQPADSVIPERTSLCTLSGGKLTESHMNMEYSYSSIIQYIQSSASNNQDTLKDGEFWCMGKKDTCENKTSSAYQFYCRTCDPNGDNIEG